MLGASFGNNNYITGIISNKNKYFYLLKVCLCLYFQNSPFLMRVECYAPYLEKLTSLEALGMANV